MKSGDLLSSPLLWVCLGGCALVAIRLLAGSLQSPVPRVAFKEMLTSAERQFLVVLINALPDFVICPQVAMGALLKVESGVENKQFWVTRNKFSQKIVDYAVVDPSDGRVLVLIELDDRSHDASRDRDRDAMLARAGYLVERFGNRPFPNVSTVRERFAFDPVIDAPSRSFGRRGRVA